MKIMATDLLFPEGPIALQDGSLILVEINRQTLSLISPQGKVSVLAECGGGPNGAAVGPDGRVYICNNGGFTWSTQNGLLRPVGTPVDYSSGSIQVVDIETGKVEQLYDRCDDGAPLRGPNDIVFDDQGGFYFTDLGKRFDDRLDRGAICYATADGNHIKRIVHPIEQPNGIALSPCGKRLYAAETFSAKVRYWDITEPGVLAPFDDPFGVGNILYGFTGHERLDSMAVDSAGHVCVATLGTGVISSISEEGRLEAIIPVPQPDVMVTNICFGGPSMDTAYITSSGLGILYQAKWHRPGHRLNYNL